MNKDLYRDSTRKAAGLLFGELNRHSDKVMDAFCAKGKTQKRKTGLSIPLTIKFVPKNDCMEIRLKSREFSFCGTATADATPTLPFMGDK